jgi:hypothetical protein
MVDMGNCGFISNSVQSVVAHNYLLGRIRFITRFAKAKFKIACYRRNTG